MVTIYKNYKLLLRTSYSLSKKWTFDLFVNRAFSRGQCFKTHVTRLSLGAQVHRAKSIDYRRQQALLRHRQAGGVHPINDVGVRLHPRAAPFKEDAQETFQADLHGEVAQEHRLE